MSPIQDAAFPPKPKIIYMLSPPPPISQIESTDCWAAALASFQRIKKIDPDASREMLKKEYSVCLSDSEEGMLPEGCIHSVFGSEGCCIENISSALFDYEYAKKMLEENEHIIIINKATSDIYHMLVVYGIGVSPAPNYLPDEKYFSVMDPMGFYEDGVHKATHENLAFSDVNIVAVGTRCPPTPEHIHSITPP